MNAGPELIDWMEQTRRRANLRHLVCELQKSGVSSWSILGPLVAGVDGPTLTGLLRDDAISDALARNIEWHAHRPVGWMDTRWECALDD